MSYLDETLETLMGPGTEGTISIRRFNLVMGVMVLVHTFVIALETDFGPRDQDITGKENYGWLTMECLFTLIFWVEVFVRMCFEGRQWVRCWWNWFDAFLASLALLDIAVLPWVQINATGLRIIYVTRIIRLARLIRIIKMIRMFHGLYVMAMAFWRAMISMVWVCAIMVMGLFICAIFATTAIGHSSNFEGVRIGTDSAYSRFGTVPNSMYSLFELMTLEGWEGVARPLVARQPVIFVFLVIFLMVFTFGLLNMIVGLVVEKTLDQARALREFNCKQKRGNMPASVEVMRTVFKEGDTDHNGELSLEEFETMLLNNEDVRQCFTDMDMPLTDARELFHVLDWDGSGSITAEELMDGCARAQGTISQNWSLAAIQGGVRNLVRSVSELRRQVARLTEGSQQWQVDFARRLALHEEQMVEHRQLLAALVDWQGKLVRHLKGHEDISALVEAQSACFATSRALLESHQDVRIRANIGRRISNTSLPGTLDSE